MNFRQRLLRYGFGVSIGVLLSVVIFSGRGCSDWLPEKRIKTRIQLNNLQTDDEVMCVIRCWQDETNKSSPLENWLLAGEIDWSKSGPRETPQRYVFNLPAESPIKSLECRFTEKGGTITQAIFRDKGDRCNCAASSHSSE